MGESRGGEGSGAEGTATSVLRSLLQDFKAEGRDPAQISVQRVTEGLYAVSVLAHGEQEPEQFFLTERTPLAFSDFATAFGGDNEESSS